MSDVLLLPLLDQRDALRNSRITSYDLTKKYIARIQECNPRLNIIVRTHFPQALQKARALDAHLASTGRPVGPLHGVPFTIKDAFRIKNFRTSYGIPGVNCLPAFDHCTAVERLISAGGVFLGQTNVPLFCFDWQTNSPLYGMTRNPLDPERTVGGSSGGSAASLAAFFSPLEVGSDIAGSIRYPAHCCGVFGLRPTHGLIPFDDAGPAMYKKTFHNMAVAGPLARTLEDLKLVLSVLTLTADSSTEKHKLKIAYTLEWSGISIDAQSKQMIERLIGGVKELGHEPIPFEPELDFTICTEIWGTIVGYEFKRMLPAPIRFRPGADLFNHFFNRRRFREGTFKESLQKGFLSNEALYRETIARAETFRNEYIRQFQDFDLWITPVSAGPAIKHQEIGTPQRLNSEPVPYTSYLGNFLTPTTIFHHPVLVAPIGSDSEFPIGVQFHGKPGQDWQLLSDVSKLKSLFRRLTPPPLFRPRAS